MTALDFIKKQEGLRLDAYPDPASGGDPWTIGYGATGPGIVKGTLWTLAQAESDLAQRVAKLQKRILEFVTVPLTKNRLTALTSFAYNVGFAAFWRSSLRSKLNAGDIEGAANSFLSWNHAAGKVNAGLDKRRHEERDLFLAPDSA